jgi:hypothetical protein
VFKGLDYNNLRVNDVIIYAQETFSNKKRYEQASIIKIRKAIGFGHVIELNNGITTLV